MFNRRTLVALATCLILSASTAIAGGNGGTKKDSTIRVRNETGNQAYVFVDVPDSQIEAAANSNDPLAAFRNLGGKQVAPEGHADFKVKAGDHTVTAVDIEDEVLIGQQNVEDLAKGETREVTFGSSAQF